MRKRKNKNNLTQRVVLGVLTFVTVFLVSSGLISCSKMKPKGWDGICATPDGMGIQLRNVKVRASMGNMVRITTEEGTDVLLDTARCLFIRSK